MSAWSHPRVPSSEFQVPSERDRTALVHTRRSSLVARHSRSSLNRRGSVIVIVLWTIAVAAIIVSSVQLFSHRQATLSREALERVQARWAARSGIENTLAVMTMHTLEPEPDDAKAMFHDMYAVGGGNLLNASYDIRHYRDGDTFESGWPMDEHSKININRATDRGMVAVLDDMTLDVMDAIGDWIDDDDDVSLMGVEREYYQSLEAPYEPRNGPLRTIAEMELIAGIWPKYFRGEDWNLNNRIDPNENDGARALPPDDDEGFLDSAWSGHLTTYSVSGGATATGLPRIVLRTAEPEELEERIGISLAQADALITYGKNTGASLTDLLFTPLTGGAEASNTNTAGGRSGGTSQNPQPSSNNRNNPGGSGSAGAANALPALKDEQLRMILSETCIEDPADRVPGKMNLNTVPATLLRTMFDERLNLDEAIADEIIYMRESRQEGIPSLVDLKGIPDIRNQDLQAIAQSFDVVSNVFTISSRGRSWASGLEVEIIAVVDRSTVPVRILEYREQ